jgi:hypothetical protein
MTRGQRKRQNGMKSTVPEQSAPWRAMTFDNAGSDRAPGARADDVVSPMAQSLWRLVGVAVLSGAMTQMLGGIVPASAQDNVRATTVQVPSPPSSDVAITAPPVLLGEPASEINFAIDVGPPDTVPRNSFLRIRGLPHMVALTEGYAIAPGAWAVPIVSLPKLRIAIPVGLSGRSEIAITLVTIEGTTVAEAKSALVIASARLIAPGEAPPPIVASPKTPAERTLTEKPAPQKPVPPPEPPAAKSAALPPPSTPVPGAAPTPSRPPLSPEAYNRATHFMSRATSLLSDGNIAAARLFFERASEEGMAEGALALGGTYDERELATMKALGLKPDPRLARRWYERARELGSRDAEARLSRLGPAR